MNLSPDQEASSHPTLSPPPSARRVLPQKNRTTDNLLPVDGNARLSPPRRADKPTPSVFGGPLPPRSPLARLQLSRARTSEEMRRLATDVWRQRGLALIDPLLIPDDFARQALINEATRLYGRKNDPVLAENPSAFSSQEGGE